MTENNQGHSAVKNKSADIPFLPLVSSPSDLKKLKVEELEALSKELRQFIIETVARTGGHLGSNLGSVEFTIALHYVFNTPRDLIVWDVGAQAYAHKILTGRMEQFHTNRQYGGISGFPKRDESPYDTFGVGHSSTSISAALGMAIARDLKKEDYKVIAVIGDGAMTGGLAFEGLNNAGAGNHDMMVILNDNSMAISPNVGALTSHLSSMRADPRFEKIKDVMWQLTGKLPRGTNLRKALRGVDAGLREILIPGLWFERLGFRYVGPIDGHNIPELVRMFKWLKTITGPVIVHIMTVKGKGYTYAENDRLALHGVGKFDPVTGPKVSSGKSGTFSELFAEVLEQCAEEDPDIVAITPAMIEGSALTKFQNRFPDRCFDVGIAEQHSLTFAAGLITQGIKPVVVIYSTFLQRAYDQLVHDIALQDLPVVFGIDRAGLVGEDGPTHHGVFDISYLRHIPKMTIFIPRNGEQMQLMFRESLKLTSGPSAIRFARGAPPVFDEPAIPNENVWEPEVLIDGEDGLIISMGPILAEVVKAVKELIESHQINLALVDLRCVKPLHEASLKQFAEKYHQWMIVEENVLQGGAGSALLEFLGDYGFHNEVLRKGIPDRFITHGDRNNLLREVALDSNSICDAAHKFFVKINSGVKKTTKSPSKTKTLSF